MSHKIRSYIELIINFTIRDLKVRYSGSVLGLAWIFFYPVAMTGITTLVFSIAFKSPAGDVPYFLFVMIGLISWVFFMQTIMTSTRSLIGNRELVANTNFPKEILILAVSLSKLVDFVLNLILFLILLYFVKSLPLTLKTIFALSIVLGAQILFQTGISLFTASLNVYYRDIQNIVDILLQVFFYLTPIVYPLTIIPSSLKTYFLFNPLTLIIDTYRDLFFSGHIDWLQINIIFVFSILVFLAGLTIFKYLEKKFVDII